MHTKHNLHGNKPAFEGEITYVSYRQGWDEEQGPGSKADDGKLQVGRSCEKKEDNLFCAG